MFDAVLPLVNGWWAHWCFVLGASDLAVEYGVCTQADRFDFDLDMFGASLHHAIEQKYMIDE